MPQMPWGNAFIIGTPKSDRLVQQIGQDQRQRELYEQRQAQLLDQEFAKNASAIRDIDISDAVKRYQQYKNIGQDLYKNGNRMTNEQRIAKQLEKQRAASDYYSLVNKSKELKEPEDLVQKNYFKAPDKMEETTPDYLMLSRRTPALQHPGVNDIMRNTELQTKDFSKIVAGAMGGANGRPVKVANDVKDNGLTSTPTDYYALNSPSQFASKVMEGIQTNRDKNKFVQQHSYSDLAAEDILRKYAIEKEKPAFKKVYPNEPDYTAEDLSDPFRKAVTLLAMEHIIRNPPTVMEERPFNNTEDVLNYNNKNKIDAATTAFNRQKIMEGIKQANRKELLGMREVAKANGASANDAWIDQYTNKLKEDAQSAAPNLYKTVDGKETYEHPVAMDAVVSKALSKNGHEPEELLLTSDGKWRPVYYKYTTNSKGETVPAVGENGVHAVDMTLSKPITDEQLKLSLGQKTVSKKNITTEMKSSSPKPTKQISRSTIKSLVGKKGYEDYSEQELVDYYKQHGYDIK